MDEETDDDVPDAALAETTPDGRPLRSFLDEDESVEYVLRGTILDTLRGSGEDAERSRTMVADPGGIATLVTAGRVLFVVGRRDRTDVTTVPRAEVVGGDAESMGEERRLTVRTEPGPDYTVYPDGAAEETVRAVAKELSRGGRDEGSINEGETDDGGSAPDADDDPLDRLERLADLRDRGALTQAEFESKKRELLDRI